MRPVLTPALALLLLAGCSIRGMAIRGLGDALASAGDVYAAESDPELARDALPFALKTTEALLAEAPEDRGLLLTACSGFTGYAYAFVELDASFAEPESYSEAERLRGRALDLYLRARDYCLRALELAWPGIGEELRRRPREAAARIDGRVELVYWTGASWGSAISLGLHRPEIVADLPAVQALMARALELDPDWDRGAIHEALISLEALPPAMGGDPERARDHFERAVELSGGTRASPYVTLAAAVAVPEQDREEFERLLRGALAVDPEAAPQSRLANELAQRRARFLLERADTLFY